MYNSLEWSLKFNSDVNVMAETLLELFTRLSPMEGGWGGGGEGMHLFFSDYLQIVKTD